MTHRMRRAGEDTGDRDDRQQLIQGAVGLLSTPHQLRQTDSIDPRRIFDDGATKEQQMQRRLANHEG